MTLVREGALDRRGRGERGPRPLIRHNDYSVLEPPGLGAWEPELGVGVVVRAFGGQEKLDLTLASLAAQTYPARLTEVVVVDDGSDPPLRLPEVRPANTRIVPARPGGWGRGHAVNTGAAATDADVVLFLDADMIAFRDHVEAQMRWHHLADHLVVTGHLRCVGHGTGLPSPAEVADAVGRGEPEALVEGPGEELAWLRRAYDRKEDLRTAGYEAFSYFIGGTGSVRRELLAECGGPTPNCSWERTRTWRTGWRSAARCSSRNSTAAAGTWASRRWSSARRRESGTGSPSSATASPGSACAGARASGSGRCPAWTWWWRWRGPGSGRCRTRWSACWG
ncbi:glycosyltransferase [Nocardiopsis sp. ARC36]